MKQVKNYTKLWRIKLVLLHFLMAGMAIPGGIGLIITDGLRLDKAILSTSPFDSFVLPGLILAGIVGGLNLLAALLIIKRHIIAKTLSAIASFGILIWTFGEIYTTHLIDSKQILVFSIGIAQLVLLLCLLGITDTKKPMSASTKE